MSGIRAGRNLVLTLALATQAVVQVCIGASAEAAEWKVGRLLVDTPLYSKPDARSPALARSPRGTQLRAYFPGQGGWVTVYLPKPINGVQYAWIPTSTLQIAGAPQAQRTQPSASSPDRALRNSWLGVGATMVMASPADYQVGIGETAKGISLMNIEGEFGYFLNPKLYGLVRGGTYSFKQAETVVTGPTAIYTAGGFYATIGLGYMLMRAPGYALGLEGNGGFSVSSASNATATQAITTSSILAFPIRFALRGQLRITGGVGMNLLAGYELHTLSQVQSYLLTNGSTAYPNMSLGGLILGGNLYYAF